MSPERRDRQESNPAYYACRGCCSCVVIRVVANQLGVHECTVKKSSARE